MPGSKLTPEPEAASAPPRPRRVVNRRRPGEPAPVTPPVNPALTAEDVAEAIKTAPEVDVAAPALPVKPKRQPVGPQKLGPLIGTVGPDPDAPVHKVRLAVGTLVGAHGVDGEMKMRLSTDNPEHLLTIKHVYVGDAPKPLALKGVRFHQGMALIKLHGVWNREAAQDLAGTTIRIAGKDALPLEPGEFYLYQMVGLEVFNEAGEKLGDVVDIMETGANDVFVVKPAGDGKEFLLPNHPDIVPIIDPANRRMVARPMVFYGDERD